MNSDLTARVQAAADADHKRQPVCSWCGKPGESYEYRGVRFDGLTPCAGNRLCRGCLEAYRRSTPLLIIERDGCGLEHLYDINENTADWSERNIPGCEGLPPVYISPPGR